METGALGKTYPAGTMLFRHGDAGDCMYVIQAGRVEVLHEHEGQEVPLTILGEVRVLTVDKRTFMRRVHEDPSLAFRILQKMSQRIRELSAELADLKARG